MTAQLAELPELADDPRPTAPHSLPHLTSLVVYGDFTCPWSYLASRRARLLADAGVTVDWRAVEHERPVPGRRPSPGRAEALREELDRVAAMLLPGERLPHAPAAMVPFTRPAVSGYAEAYGAGVADAARQVLFEAFWQHGVDLGDPRLVRTVLADVVRAGHSDSDPLRDWGYAVDVTGGPVTTTGWRLARRWREEWTGAGKEVVPVVVAGGRPMFGVDAVEWLGNAVLALGLALQPRPRLVHRPANDRDLATLSWVSQHGSRWLEAYRAAHAAPLFGPEGVHPWR